MPRWIIEKFQSSFPYPNNESIPPALQGSIAGSSTLGADASNNHGSSSVNSGNSGLNGLLSISRGVIGQINGQSVLGPDLGEAQAQNGGISSSSSINGVLLEARRIVGQIDSSSNLSGQAGLVKSLAGQVSGISSLTSQLSRTENIVSLIQGSSDINGQSTNSHGLLDISLTGQTSLTGNLSLLHPVLVAGSIDGQSTLGLDLKRAAAEQTVASGSSAIDGILTAIKSLVGSTDGSSNVLGQISKTDSILSSIAANSIISGAGAYGRNIDANLFGSSRLQTDTNVARKLVGQIDGLSSFSADLDVQRDNQKVLVGAIHGSSTFVPDTAISHTILSQVNGQSSFGAETIVSRSEHGQTLGTSNVDAVVGVARALVGSISSASTTGDNVDLTNSRFIASTINAQSAVSGNLSAPVGLYGSITADSYLVASILNAASVTGYSVGASDLSIGVLVDRKLLTQLVDVSGLRGSLSVDSINPANFKVMDCVLNILTNKNITLSTKNEANLTLNRKSEFDLVLER